MQTKVKKAVRTPLAKHQERLFRHSLRTLLGPGLLELPRKGHDIRPAFLRDAFDLCMLKK